MSCSIQQCRKYHPREKEDEVPNDLVQPRRKT